MTTPTNDCDNEMMHPLTSNPSYSIDIDLDTIDDATALDLMRRALTAATARMIRNNAIILADNYSDDDTDYFPANAEIAYYLTAALTNSDESPRDLFIRFCNLNPDAIITSECALPFIIESTNLS